MLCLISGAKSNNNLTLSQTTNFRLFQTESLQMTISNLMKMAKSFSKGVENVVGKGEIARYEQFLLFPRCFQKSCTVDTLKPGLVLERGGYVAF